MSWVADNPVGGLVTNDFALIFTRTLSLVKQHALPSLSTKRIFADNCHVLSFITFVWSWSSSPKVVHWVVVLKAAWSMLVTSSDDKSRSVPTNYVSMVTVPPSSLVMSTLAHLLVGMTVPRENTHAVGEHRHLWVQMSPTRRPPIDWAEKCSARLPLVTPATTHYSKLTRPSSFVLQNLWNGYDCN